MQILLSCADSTFCANSVFCADSIDIIVGRNQAWPLLPFLLRYKEHTQE